LTLSVPRRAQLRVTTSLEQAAYFMPIGPDGLARQLYLFQWILDGTLEGANITSWGEIEAGGSSTYATSDGEAVVQL
jgi:hypothetical protein